MDVEDDGDAEDVLDRPHVSVAYDLCYGRGGQESRNFVAIKHTTLSAHIALCRSCTAFNLRLRDVAS